MPDYYETNQGKFDTVAEALTAQVASPMQLMEAMVLALNSKDPAAISEAYHAVKADESVNWFIFGNDPDLERQIQELMNQPLE